MEQTKKFSNLGTPARVIIYIVNALLAIGSVQLCVIVFGIGLWGSLYALGSLKNGGAIFLFLFFLIMLWFLGSFACFFAVIAIAVTKKRWSWILQFLPFVTGG